MAAYIIKGVVAKTAIFIYQKLGTVPLLKWIFGYPLLGEGIGVIRYFNNWLQIRVIFSKDT